MGSMKDTDRKENTDPRKDHIRHWERLEVNVRTGTPPEETR